MVGSLIGSAPVSIRQNPRASAASSASSLGCRLKISSISASAGGRLPKSIKRRLLRARRRREDALDDGRRAAQPAFRDVLDAGILRAPFDDVGARGAQGVGHGAAPDLVGRLQHGDQARQLGAQHLHAAFRPPLDLDGARSGIERADLARHR